MQLKKRRCVVWHLVFWLRKINIRIIIAITVWLDLNQSLLIWTIIITFFHTDKSKVRKRFLCHVLVHKGLHTDKTLQDTSKMVEQSDCSPKQNNFAAYFHTRDSICPPPLSGSRLFLSPQPPPRGASQCVVLQPPASKPTGMPRIKFISSYPKPTTSKSMGWDPNIIQQIFI